MNSRTTILGFVLASFCAASAQAQAPAIPVIPVTNINIQGDSNPANFTQVDGKLFFTASDRVGPALFVKNLLKGKTIDPKLDTPPVLLKRLTNSVDQFVVKGPPGNEQLYFHLLNSGLWTSRGTPATTTLLKKVDQLAPLKIQMSFLTAFKSSDLKNGRLFFAAIAPGKGYELWSSNGTATGTQLFDNINGTDTVTNGDIYQISSIPYQMVDVNSGTDHLVFGASKNPTNAGGANPFQLWTSDGTVPGTKPLTTNLALEPHEITGTGSLDVPGGHCYFSASGVTNTGMRELWITDGSTDAANTVCATDNRNVNPVNLASFGNAILFSGHDDANGNELWISRESSPLTSTAMVIDINPGVGDSNPHSIVNAGNKFAYFVASPDGTHVYLYRTDGTENGTALVVPTNSALSPTSANHGHLGNPAGITSLLDENGDGFVFFAADDGNGNSILWQTANSVGAQASPVTTPQGSAIKNPTGMTAVQLANPPISRLYFSAPVSGSGFGDKGTEVWVYKVE